MVAKYKILTLLQLKQASNETRRKSCLNHNFNHPDLHPNTYGESRLASIALITTVAQPQNHLCVQKEVSSVSTLSTSCVKPQITGTVLLTILLLILVSVAQ